MQSVWVWLPGTILDDLTALRTIMTASWIDRSVCVDWPGYEPFE